MKSHGRHTATHPNTHTHPDSLSHSYIHTLTYTTPPTQSRNSQADHVLMYS